MAMTFLLYNINRCSSTKSLERKGGLSIKISYFRTFSLISFFNIQIVSFKICNFPKTGLKTPQ